MTEHDVAEALARNDRYLREFVEALGICPFAQRCREMGRLDRKVDTGGALDEGNTLAHLVSLLQPRAASVEVSLLIFPQLNVSEADFERFATRIRELHPESADGFFVVAFHPESRIDTTTAAKAVAMMRRSPDPTLQFVRRSVLERVRGERANETRWMDPLTIDPSKPLPASAPSVSDRIAEANVETVRRVGLERVVALLASMRD